MSSSTNDIADQLVASMEVLKIDWGYENRLSGDDLDPNTTGLFILFPYQIESITDFDAFFTFIDKALAFQKAAGCKLQGQKKDILNLLLEHREKLNDTVAHTRCMESSSNVISTKCTYYPLQQQPLFFQSIYPFRTTLQRPRPLSKPLGPLKHNH